jgi:hypothetical protein
MVAAAGRIERKRKKEMNKFVLPSAAALLILVIAVSSFTPAIAVTRVTLAPFLQVQTIPEDDQLRNTGVMLLGLGAATPKPTDFMAQYKIIVTLNGLLVPASGLIILCNVAEKDKEPLPPWKTTGKSPTNVRQFPNENLKTTIVDVAQYFVCKFRPKGTESVGVLDVYYNNVNGPDKAFIADHILVVQAMYTVGRQVFYGAEIQDICILGWNIGGTYAAVTKYYTNSKGDQAAGDKHWLLQTGDPLGTFPGCEDAALFENQALGQMPFEA